METNYAEVALQIRNMSWEFVGIGGALNGHACRSASLLVCSPWLRASRFDGVASRFAFRRGATGVGACEQAMKTARIFRVTRGNNAPGHYQSSTNTGVAGSGRCLHTPDISSLLQDAQLLHPLLQQLKRRTFFRIFKLNIKQKTCADTPAAAADLVTDEDEGKCEAPEKCGLCTCSDEQVPLSWKQKPIEDFVDRRHAAAQPPVYVDLMRNPPGYTEYQGGPIWDALQHQLFRLQQQELQQNYQGDARTCGTAAKLSLILSGMQSNISALAGEYYYSNFSQLHQQSEQQDAVETPLPPTPAPSVSFFLSRFARHPERLQSLFFTFAFILKGVCRLTDVLQECSCETGNTSDDLPARAELLQVLNATASQLSACNSPLAGGGCVLRSPLGFLESAESIESLLRCVSCEKCQLHGTIKLTALRLAAKAATENTPLTHLERNEVTATLNALYYFADSILAVERMRFRRSSSTESILPSSCISDAPAAPPLFTTVFNAFQF
ncbi:endoplasmic reticulum oxidoreductin-2 [Cyclospora cayetanensis]|uniref:Endoplasmic reticulum oxidoreductin-2 n=1 Tax=Cyclospora cayetanensis TaxID=88456 RepID=A0A6P6RW00_9EIME|nr:endoplasmic reticulum oxidoreductin-2 [Cyclospora cayetanensis]